MKVLKNLASVMLISASMLSASGYTYFDGIAEEESMPKAWSQVGTHDFKITYTEVVAAVLTTMFEVTESNDAKSSLTSIISSMQGEGVPDISSKLESLDFSTEEDEERRDYLINAKDGLASFLSTPTPVSSPVTWYESKSPMVPQQLFNEGTIWNINFMQQQVFELARYTKDVTMHFEGDADKATSLYSLLILPPSEARHLLENCLFACIDSLRMAKTLETKKNLLETFEEMIKYEERNKKRLKSGQEGADEVL